MTAADCPSWCTNCTAQAPSGEHRSRSVDVRGDTGWVASVYIAQRPGGRAGVVFQQRPGELFDPDAADRVAAAWSRVAAELRQAGRGRVLDR